MPRPKQVCSVDGCGKPHLGLGLCAMHYARQKRGFKGAFALAFIEKAAAYKDATCLIWPYSLTSEGYGSVNYSGIRGTAARVVCTLVYGPPSHKGLEVAHWCNNRACVAPAHLRWATGVDNSADKLRHGTLLRGSLINGSKLTVADVLAVRAQRHRTRADLATEYGVAPTTIGDIRLRRTWHWLED